MSIRVKRCMCVAAVVTALGVGILLRVTKPSQELVQANISIIDLSGEKLPNFFEGLPPNGKIREILFRGKPPRRVCGQKSGVISGIMKALGLEKIVHAQTPCNNLDCQSSTFGCFTAVTNIVCTECGSGSKNVWQLDFLNHEGFKEYQSVACNNADCGCNYQQCSCIGG
jgi:hypothetical protein